MIEKRKVIFVAHVQSHIINFHQPFIKYFQNKGYEVYVATKLDTNKYKNCDIILPNVKWVNINFDRNPISAKNINSTIELIRLMKNIKFDLVHVHTPVGGVLGRIAAKLTKTGPVIYTAHGFHFYKGSKKSYWIKYYTVEKILSKWTDILITINEEDFKLASRKFKNKNNRIYKVDGVGIDENKYAFNPQNNIETRKEFGLTSDDFVITVIAELIQRKNHIQIIEAMKEIKAYNSKIKVLFAGDGILYDELNGKIKEYKLEGQIKLLGYRSDINSLLNISDIIALFSIHEGLPRNILEGMANGKAIICTNIRGNCDLVQDKENGILVEVDNISETIEAINYSFNNKEVIKKMGELNKKFIKKYSEEKILNYMDYIYNIALDSN